MIFHTPVLLNEAVDGLDIKPGGKYIDATIGGGGHAAEIIKRGGKVLGIDQDKDAIEHVQSNNKEQIEEGELKLVQGNFADIEKIARENEFLNADGILFDLGFSSYQMEQSGRGFSFLRDEPLDMRMSDETSLTASEIINEWSKEELYEIFGRFGEEENAAAISDAIVRTRRIKPIERSLELADVTLSVAKQSHAGKKIHPATRVFQALRIVVNSEIDNLKKGLVGSFEILGVNGRLAVISFHSLEDRIVKLYFLKLEREGKGKIITRKVITASYSEVRNNKRARSAKLRIFARLR